MAPRVLRWAVMSVCAAGIAGMIVSSILDANGAALTFGLITAVAAVCLIVATAVTPAPVDRARVDELVDTLIAGGADEATVRALVAEASATVSAKVSAKVSARSSPRREKGRGGGARRTHP